VDEIARCSASPNIPCGLSRLRHPLPDMQRESVTGDIDKLGQRSRIVLNGMAIWR
jgi:hypothetical protein